MRIRSRARWIGPAFIGLLAGCSLLAGLGPERRLVEGTVATGGGGGAAASAITTVGTGGDLTEGGGARGTPHPDACDSTSDVLWVKTFGDAGFENVTHMESDGAGGVYLSGWFTGVIDFGGGPLISYGDRDFYVARLDADGDEVWAKHYGTQSFDEQAPSLIAHRDGVVLTGYAFTDIDLGDGPHDVDGYDAYAALLDGLGDLQWETWVGGPGDQRTWGYGDVDPVSGDVLMGLLYDAEVTVAGQTFTPQGGGDGLAVRLDATTGAIEAARSFATPRGRPHPPGARSPQR